MGVAVVYLMMIIQPAIIGYIAQKQLQKPGAGIFFGVVAFILSCFVAYLCVQTERHTLVADGVITTGLGGLDGLFISVGASSAVVLAIVTILRNRQATIPSRSETYPHTHDSKICPFCAEHIKSEAIVCRYCGRDLPPSPGRPTQS